MPPTTLHSVSPVLLLATLLPLGWAVFQDGDDPEVPPAQDPPVEVPVPLDTDGQFFGSAEGEEDGLPLRKAILGCWRAISIEAEGYPSEGIDLLAYLVVTGDFMSLELQAAWDDTLDEAPQDAYETFTARYRFTRWTDGSAHPGGLVHRPPDRHPRVVHRGPAAAFRDDHRRPEQPDPRVAGQARIEVRAPDLARQGQRRLLRRRLRGRSALDAFDPDPPILDEPLPSDEDPEPVIDEDDWEE
ncbi:MAG: hypothetical protein R3F17_09015 [Planctomycetota bacterium]